MSRREADPTYSSHRKTVSQHVGAVSQVVSVVVDERRGQKQSDMSLGNSWSCKLISATFVLNKNSSFGKARF